MEVVSARDWYNDVVLQSENRYFIEATDNQTLLALALVDLVARADEIPSTFIFDEARIRSLSRDYQIVTFQRATQAAFEHILRTIGFKGIVPLPVVNGLLNRIRQIQPQGLIEESTGLPSEDVILEIAAAAYRFYGRVGLPCDVHIAEVRDVIHDALSGQCSLANNLDYALQKDIECNVVREVKFISSLTPLQIFQRYTSLSLPQEAEQNLYVTISQHIAHIAVLHWRVWSPILYLQSEDIFHGGEYLFPVEEEWSG